VATANCHTIHIIAGPTASGKSALALQKAHDLNGVIINADSMQVYNALPILTAQPSADDMAAAPHELYGVCPPNEPFSAGTWNEQARALIASLLDQGKTPIVVGGTGLYIKALTEGFSPLPQVPAAVRARVTALQQELGNPGFYEALKKIDPVMAARFHPHHTARLLRAYEVMEATGKSLAEFQDIPPNAPPEEWAFEIPFSVIRAARFCRSMMRCSSSRTSTHILVRHEQAAVHAAEGYARSTGKVGVVLVTSGPGATNAVTGLTDALMDSIPIVCFSGQVPTFLIGNDAFQEADTTGITRPCTKHNYLCKDTDKLAGIFMRPFTSPSPVAPALC
jgi:hypothetical protein